MKLLRSALIPCMLLVFVPAAFAQQQFEATPVPEGTEIQHLKIGNATADECGMIYENMTNFTGFAYSAGANYEVADGIHMLSAGNLCSFDFAYYKQVVTTTDATVTFYANDPTDNPPAVVVAGPYMLSGLPGGGSYGIHVDVAPVPVPADVWMAVSFSTSSTGLLIFDPPTIGFSADYFFQTPPGDYGYFGGSPVANFGFTVAAAIATPARPSTWGSLKQLYR